jgi:hypothetical protein
MILTCSTIRERINQDAQKVRPARPQRPKQAEVEVKVERRFELLPLSLNLSLNLPITLAGYTHPVSSQGLAWPR